MKARGFTSGGSLIGVRNLWCGEVPHHRVRITNRIFTERFLLLLFRPGDFALTPFALLSSLPAPGVG